MLKKVKIIERQLEAVIEQAPLRYDQKAFSMRYNGTPVTLS
jgi:hypothetical protein